MLWDICFNQRIPTLRSNFFLQEGRFHFILLVNSDLTSLFSHGPQIAKTSLGGQCLYKTKYAL